MSFTLSTHRSIATQNEGPLHASLKRWYAEPGDRTEVPVGGRQIDLVRANLLIEIQTGSFASIARKLRELVEEHRVRLVHPVAIEKWIVRVEGDDQRVVARRRSPRRGRIEHAFPEWVSVADLFAHPRFSLEVLLVREEELRRHEPGRAWRRRGWVVVERRLIDVVERRLFGDACDLLRLLPPGLPGEFTTADLSAALGVTRDLAQKMAFCLREAGVIDGHTKHGRSRAYRVRD